MNVVSRCGVKRRLLAAALAFAAFWAALELARYGWGWLAALGMTGGVGWMFWGERGDDA